MHGMGGNGKQHQSMSRFDAIANRENFLVAYPDGIDKRWDIDGTTDVNFILAILDSAAKRFDIDKGRASRRLSGVRDRELLHVRGYRTITRPSMLDLRGRLVGYGDLDATSPKSVVTDMSE
jgi:hypothetical protein